MFPTKSRGFMKQLTFSLTGNVENVRLDLVSIDPASLVLLELQLLSLESVELLNVFSWMSADP